MLAPSATLRRVLLPLALAAACADSAPAPSWRTQSSGVTANLSSVWGSSARDVFAVGSGGTILHYDGNAWTAQPGQAADLQDVWGTSGTDVFAVGAGGAILHYDGRAWTPQASGTTRDLFALWGSSRS